MDLCPAFNLLSFAHETSKKALVTHLRCKKWSCEYCAALNQKQWRRFLLTKCEKIGLYWSFVTITAHSMTRGAATSLANLQSNIPRFIARLKRCFGKLEYVRIYERHPTSEAIHAHLLIHGLTDYVAVGTSVKHQWMSVGVLEKRSRFGIWSLKTYIKHAAQACGMGYIADAQSLGVGHERAVWYVTKYMTKAAQSLGVKGLRHIQTSQGIGSPKPSSELFWQVGLFVTARDFKPGQEVVTFPGGKALPDDYFEVHDAYPPEYDLEAGAGFSTAHRTGK